MDLIADISSSDQSSGWRKSTKTTEHFLSILVFRTNVLRTHWPIRLYGDSSSLKPFAKCSLIVSSSAVSKSKAARMKPAWKADKYSIANRQRVIPSSMVASGAIPGHRLILVPCQLDGASSKYSATELQEINRNSSMLLGDDDVPECRSPARPLALALRGE
ncbi:hypothetical protein I7I51_02781 [Histoplasma capsulatum]|uniref:Uncharacterized protein n=1 Tax=Ajellomyces capsulatus TaxID=5037 RepID=A0A8A1MPM0_AJECA|nr:hypothetical protein I7I51_02781 [Histoplasma capsulatum]